MTEIKFNPGSVELYKTIVKPGLETKVSGDTKEDSMESKYLQMFLPL